MSCIGLTRLCPGHSWKAAGYARGLGLGSYSALWSPPGPGHRPGCGHGDPRCLQSGRGVMPSVLLPQRCNVGWRLLPEAPRDAESRLGFPGDFFPGTLASLLSLHHGACSPAASEWPRVGSFAELGARVLCCSWLTGLVGSVGLCSQILRSPGGRAFVTSGFLLDQTCCHPSTGGCCHLLVPSPRALVCTWPCSASPGTIPPLFPHLWTPATPRPLCLCLWGASLPACPLQCPGSLAWTTPFPVGSGPPSRAGLLPRADPHGYLAHAC